MRWPPPLRYSIPGMIFAVGLLLSLASYLFETRVADRHLSYLLERHVSFVGNQISSVAVHFLEQEDLHGLTRQISSVGADPVLNLAVICDDQHLVLASSQAEYKGRHLSETPLAYASSRLAESSPAGARVDADRKVLVGVFPFLLPPSQGQLFSTRSGYLLMEYDLAHPTKQVRKALVDRAVIVTIGLVLVCVFTWWLFHVTINRRIQKLVAAANRLAAGETYLSPNLSGSDEIAALSAAFDRMAQENSERTREIRDANHRMRQEITERQFVEEALRNSERKFRSIWENSVDAMRLTDSKGIILAVNPAFCRLVNLPPEDLLQQPYTIAYSGEEKDRFQRYLDRFANRTIEQRHEREVTLRSGRQIWLEITHSFMDLGQKTLLLGIFRDVTERKQQEEQRKVLERKLLDAQKLESLGVLAGGIAHDFNNLLTAILGNASLARLNESLDPSIQNNLTNIEKTSLRAAELCKQMLAYSGRGKFTFEHLSLNEVARETAELLDVSISKKASLQLDLREPLPLTLADPAQIRQVLMNLVINASEAIGEKPGMIRVKSGVVSADAEYLASTHLPEEMVEGDYVFLEVRDNGCGMDPETLARIFDPFFTTKFTGRGLGLAAVLGIVRAHRGALKAASEPGKGTVFTVLFPVAEAPTAPASAPTRNSQPGWQSHGTILVADDDPHVRAVTARMVQKFGFDVLQAVDGRHAVEVFSQNSNHIKAVVLDMTMPQLNGDEAFAEMRRIDPLVRVLMVSGYSQSNGAVRRENGHPSAFLQKPFLPEELSQKLQNVLARES